MIIIFIMCFLILGIGFMWGLDIGWRMGWRGAEKIYKPIIDREQDARLALLELLCEEKDQADWWKEKTCGDGE